jgi:Alpha amylase, catalytic domain
MSKPHEKDRAPNTALHEADAVNPFTDSGDGRRAVRLAAGFALSVGKKNFFTYGEVFDNDEKIAGFIGRSTRDQSELVGVDAALDFPLRFTLPPVIKGFASPATVSGMYRHRKDVEREILSSHGDATRFFVTFLDNHNVKERIRFVDPNDEHKFDPQVTAGLACLFGLQGIPCVYYGSEQGLHGKGTDEAVREALWGGPGFDETNPFYVAISAIATVRREAAALRYGRQYFRPISGDGQHFGVSPFPGGIISFSRILNDQEIIVARQCRHGNCRCGGDHRPDIESPRRRVLDSFWEPSTADSSRSGGSAQCGHRASAGS